MCAMVVMFVSPREEVRARKVQARAKARTRDHTLGSAGTMRESRASSKSWPRQLTRRLTQARNQQKNNTYERTISRGAQYQRGGVPRSKCVVTVAPIVCRATAARNAIDEARQGCTSKARVAITRGESSGSMAKTAGSIDLRSLAQRV